MDDIRHDLGARLRQLRKERGQSQDELAYDANVAKNTISDIERGETWPNFETLQAIAGGLGTTVRDLFVMVSVLEDASPELSESLRELVALALTIPEDDIKIYLEAMRATSKRRNRPASTGRKQ